MWFDFRWIAWNLDKIDQHGLHRDEVEFIVCNAQRPYPHRSGPNKWTGRGFTQGGRALQVIDVFDDDGAVFVIHDRPLTRNERLRLRKMP